MLYFAYGSNLNHERMKKRCKDSHFIKSIHLKRYSLTFRSKHGVADIEKNKNTCCGPNKTCNALSSNCRPTSMYSTTVFVERQRPRFL